MTTELDADVLKLAELATALAANYVSSDTNPWEGSPFEWIRNTSSSRRKGAIAEALVDSWCREMGFDVRRSSNTDADRIVQGHRIEIKFSTLWDSGVYKFQQIRDQDYDYLFCIGISPFDAQAWLIPKGVLLDYVIGHMGQHTGASGSDTAWLSFPATKPYTWLSPYGGRLPDVQRILQELGHGEY